MPPVLAANQLRQRRRSLSNPTSASQFDILYTHSPTDFRVRLARERRNKLNAGPQPDRISTTTDLLNQPIRSPQKQRSVHPRVCSIIVPSQHAVSAQCCPSQKLQWMPDYPHHDVQTSKTHHAWVNSLIDEPIQAHRAHCCIAANHQYRPVNQSCMYVAEYESTTRTYHETSARCQHTCSASFTCTQAHAAHTTAQQITPPEQAGKPRPY